MPCLVDYVRAPDGRCVGLRCATCGVVFVGPDKLTEHADHTWAHHPPPGFRL